LVDMKIVTSSTTATTATGTIYVNWEDSEQGGDYDQDMWGLVRYTVTSTTATIETIAIAESTNQPQGFGYIISGTTKDGPHFHSGIEGFNYTDPQSGVLGCTNCQISGGQSGWQSQAYTVGTSTASSLKDPLWYASKWGGFKEQAVDGVPATTPNNLPDLAKEWDSKVNKDGSSCASPPCDGLPDNYFLVSNPLGLETALDKAFVAILATSSAASVATNSTSLNSGTYVYQARFNPATWSGQLLAYSIDIYGNIASTPAWDAGEEIPAANARVLITANPANTDGDDDAVPFQWDDLTAAQQAALNLVPFANPATSDTNGSTRLDYLRGDPTNEGAASGSYRSRNGIYLGDIANSTPAYVGPPSKFSFDASYVTFKNDNDDRAAVLYAGGNDGMLHAFSATDGEELFGFIPSAVYPNLSKLTDQTYNQRHAYFVDGSPTFDDVKINTDGIEDAWHTVLVGGLNAGGRGYYALDITDPTVFSSAANASDILLWEFNHTTDSDLGYTYAKPIIAKMANGKMAAIVGNGYNSTNGKAALFILYLEGGVDGAWSATSSTGGTNGSTIISTDYVKIDTGIGTAASPNGMGTVFVADYDGDGVADYIYGGDLKGNLWKFDVSNASPSNWKISFPAATGFANGQPLYVAKDANNALQPITAPPEVSLHPNGGLLVYFGTGKYLESMDDQSSASAPFTTQSMYGIWDRQLKNSAASDANAVPVTGRSQLMVQTAFSNVTVGGQTYRVLTKHQPNYSGTDRTNAVYRPERQCTRRRRNHTRWTARMVLRLPGLGGSDIPVFRDGYRRTNGVYATTAKRTADLHHVDPDDDTLRERWEPAF
jgi:type IV pilus assembly protein PilY1